MLTSWALYLIFVVALFYLAINLIYMTLIHVKTVGKKMSSKLTIKPQIKRLKKSKKSASGTISDRVRVYWNLHRQCWSVQQKGLVVDHLESFTLKDCQMIVQPAGNARVKKEQRKNVHAFIGGELTNLPMKRGDRISYNPYSSPNFFIVKSGEPIEFAEYVIFTPEGKCYLGFCDVDTNNTT